MPAAPSAWPLPLDAYGDSGGGGLAALLWERIVRDPFNLVATLLFLGAILHTFFAPALTRKARRWSEEAPGSFRAEAMHFLGEVEAVFGIWVVPLLLLAALFKGWPPMKAYVEHGVSFVEPAFIVVIMVMASSRPVLLLAERALGLTGARSPLGWWLAILTLGPVLGSFITEPAAMTICALLLAKEFYRFSPGPALAYGTLGLLFVNVSVGGTLSHFAAPPVLMVAERWQWDLPFMFLHFGWKACAGIAVSNLLYMAAFWRRLRALGTGATAGSGAEEDEKPVPAWITAVHVAFIAWTVFNGHSPILFIGGFLFFLAFVQATQQHQETPDLKAPVLVGFFLAGLVVHGGLQGWWIAPVLGRLGEIPLLLGSTVLTAFNDNAAITYLATLVPDLGEKLKYLIVAGAVTGGGLTVIANAPNPAGQAILSRFFPNGISPLGLLLGAAVPTLILLFCFYRLA